jgi:transposase
MEHDSLTPAEYPQGKLEEATAAMRQTKDKRLFEPYQCVVLHLSGEPRKRIAAILRRCEDTVNTYIQAYEAQGLAGLELGHSPGRPCRLTLEQEQELYRTVTEKRPADVGFPAQMNWTSFLARDWIERTWGVVYQPRAVRKIFHRMGLSFTKPTYTLAKADPVRQEAFKGEFEGVKKIGGGRN